MGAVFLIALILGLLIGPFQNLLHGIIQNAFGGYSPGKMILIFSWLVAVPLIAIGAHRAKIHSKIEKHGLLFLKVFAVFCVLGYALGLLQFNFYAMQFNALGPFATMISSENYTNWEASKLSHNHFPKLTLYAVEKALGLNFSNKFDDGRPWFEIFPQAGAFAIAFALILIVAIASGILHLISRLRGMGQFDFVVFELAVISAAITILDGGIASSYAIFAIFLFVLYYLRNYFEGHGKQTMHLLALFATAFVFLIVSALVMGLSDIFVMPTMLLIGIAYYFYKSFREKALSFNLWNSALAIVLVVSASVAAMNIASLGFGSPLMADEKGISRIFAYGLPADADEGQLQGILAQFGEVEQLSKTHWAAYAEIKAKAGTRTKAIEKALAESLKPSSYLYVEDVIPIMRISIYRIHWLGGLGNKNAGDF
ncbi:MAG: hypothetical protein HYW05_05585, partial [Candidatus Diapherotrites archaeon]|nr:hypothetical protein [Candidatus Diapherotrites archaeon]